MTLYREIVATQPPIDIGTDPTGRQMMDFNIRCSAVTKVDRFEEEIAKILIDAGIVTAANSFTKGSSSTIPSGTTAHGPYILIKSTGGFRPRFTHDGRREVNLTCQITVWAKSYDICVRKARDIHDELNGKRDIEVSVN